MRLLADFVMSRLIDLTGKRFGKLEVLGRAENKGKRTIWRCRCDCGNEKDVGAWDLRSGSTKSCGCYRVETAQLKRIDLVGKRFGRLFVKSQAGSYKNGDAMYNCICDCGAETVTYGWALRKGDAKSCGCYIKEITAKKVKNLEGNRFGRLIVVSRARNNKKGHPMWVCKCDCGQQTVVLGRSLRTGHTQSCGCIQKEVTSRRGIEWMKSPDGRRMLAKANISRMGLGTKTPIALEKLVDAQVIRNEITVELRNKSEKHR